MSYQNTHVSGLQTGSPLMILPNGEPAFAQGGTGLYRLGYPGKHPHGIINHVAQNAWFFVSEPTTPVVDQIYTTKVSGRPFPHYYSGDAYPYYTPEGNISKSVPLYKHPRWNQMHPDGMRYLLATQGIEPRYPKFSCRQ